MELEGKKRGKEETDFVLSTLEKGVIDSNVKNFLGLFF